MKKQAQDLKATIKITECVPGKPVVVITILGKDPNLPSILLNSHMDVVPVFPVSLVKCFYLKFKFVKVIKIFL